MNLDKFSGRDKLFCGFLGFSNDLWSGFCYEITFYIFAQHLSEAFPLKHYSLSLLLHLLFQIQYDIVRVKQKMKELASLHDKHLNRPTLDDSSEEERAIEITTQEITQVQSTFNSEPTDRCICDRQNGEAVVSLE